MKRYFIWVLILTLLAGTVSACGGGGPKTSPEDDLKTFFEAFKAKDFEKAQGYIIGEEDKPFEMPEDDDPMTKKAMDLLTAIDYEIKDVKEDGENRIVNIDLTHVDLDTAMEQIMSNVMAKAMELAMSGEDVDIEAKAEEMVLEEFDKVINDESAKITEAIPVTMVPSDGKWKIDMEKSKELEKALVPEDIGEEGEAAEVEGNEVAENVNEEANETVNEEDSE
ncbi:MAG: hypothetical protein Q4Q07_07770 [Tissierellia bacterium]|nr:hypothetical protein [Tissierellia bacterium]